jgi:hypothetical protein
MRKTLDQRKLLFPIDFHRSECRDREDHQEILKILEELGGSNLLNQRIERKIRNWLVVSYSASIFHLHNAYFFLVLVGYILSSFAQWSDDIYVVISLMVLLCVLMFIQYWVLVQSDIRILQRLALLGLLFLSVGFFVREYFKSYQLFPFMPTMLPVSMKYLCSALSIIVVGLQKCYRAYLQLSRKKILLLSNIRRCRRLLLVIGFFMDGWFGGFITFAVLHWWIPSIDIFNIIIRNVFLLIFTIQFLLHVIVLYFLKEDMLNPDKNQPIRLTNIELIFVKNVRWNCLCRALFYPLLKLSLCAIVMKGMGWFDHFQKDPFYYIVAVEFGVGGIVTFFGNANILLFTRGTSLFPSSRDFTIN